MFYLWNFGVLYRQTVQVSVDESEKNMQVDSAFFIIEKSFCGNGESNPNFFSFGETRSLISLNGSKKL